jgi:DNA polymerase-1
MLSDGRFPVEAEDLRLYRRLATMDRTAPVPPMPNQEPQWERASALAKQWELNALAERLLAFGRLRQSTVRV